MNRTIHQLDELVELKDSDEFAVYDTDSGNTKKYTADGLKVPVGRYFLYEGTIAPNDHYFICDGTDTTGTEKELAIVYPKLYAKLGNSNVLPDLRGRTPINANYSTDEVKTGKTWIDGKPIYSRTFTSGLTGTEGVLDSNPIYDNIINQGGWMKIAAKYPIANGRTDRSLVLRVNENHTLGFLKDSVIVDYNVWIEYTKTTDSAETSTMNFIIRAD